MEDPQTFTENKDGTISVKDTEGKETRYAKESDLLAVKGSQEAAERKAREDKESHTAEVGTANTNLATTKEQLLQAEAKVSNLEEDIKKGVGSASELADVKQKLETANTSREELTTKVLDYKRQAIVTTYRIPADSVKDKTIEELDNYEEALKAVTAARGAGNYAIGAGAGAGALSKKPIELARDAYSKSK